MRVLVSEGYVEGRVKMLYTLGEMGWRMRVLKSEGYVEGMAKMVWTLEMVLSSGDQSE